MKKAFFLLAIVGVLFFACDNGSTGDPPIDNSRIVLGTFTSDIGTAPATLSINVGDVTSINQIAEVISGTISDNGKSIVILGGYDQEQDYFFLSGGETNLIYYVEGYLKSSFTFEEADTEVNIAINNNPTDDYGWEMKARHQVTNQ